MPLVSRLIEIIRRQVLGAGLVMVPLFFWLPAHEVFEQPKHFALLLYGLILAALSLPLYVRAWKSPQAGRKNWLRVALILVAAFTVSLFNGIRLLPTDPFVCLEQLSGLWACAATGLTLVLETPQTLRRSLRVLVITYAVVCFYGLIQLLDQSLARAVGIQLDLVRWISFGESRVYATMGNPDYLGALLSLALPLFAALGPNAAWVSFRAALRAAVLCLLIVPIFILWATNNTAGLMIYGYWAALCVALLLGLWKATENAAWLGFLYLMILLIVVAQGRGAYLGLAGSAAALGAILLWKEGTAFFKARRGFFIKNAAVLALLPLGLAACFGLRALSPDSRIVQAGPMAAALKVADSTINRVKLVFDTRSNAHLIRFFYWKSALKMGLDHPLLGVGYGNHALFTALEQSAIWKQWEKDNDPAIYQVEPHVELYAHNDVLQNFAESGLVGLAGYFLFWGWYFRRAWKLYRRCGARADGPGRLALGLFGLGVAFWISSLLNFPWKVLASLQFCFVAYALLARAEESALWQASHAGPEGPVYRPGFFSGEKPPEAPALPAWLNPLLAGALALAFLLAMLPLKWFNATIFIRLGNNGKNAVNSAYAVKYYEKAVACGLNGTQRIETYLYLGSMYNELKRPDKALEWFNQGIAIYPAFIECLYNTGYTYMTLYQASHDAQDQSRAEQYFLKVLDINPRYINALNNLGNIYYERRDLGKAQAAYQTLLKYKPDSYEAQYNLASTYLLLQDRDKALEGFQKTLELKPDYDPAKAWMEKLKKLPKGVPIRFQ